MPHALPLQTSQLQEGTFVVFELDTITTMWHLGPSVQALAAKIPTQKYVAFVGQVVDSGGYDLWGQPVKQCELHLIGTGMPKPHPYHVTDEAMSVPLFPATTRPASESTPRQPLVPAPPLPENWVNCFQHSLMTRTVYIKDIHGKNATSSKLPQKDVLRHYAFSWEDRQREAALFTAEVIKLQGSVLHGGNVSPVQTGDNLKDEETQDRFSEDNVWLDPGGVQNLSCDQRSTHVQTSVTVDVWLDLSSVSEPPDPRGFFEELGMLLRIEESIKPNLERPQDIISYLDPEAQGST